MSVTQQRQQQGEQMARLKVKTAQLFAQEQRFLLARDILEATDHPNADQLLQRIIPHLPPAQPAPPRFWQWGRWLSVALLMLVVGIGVGRITLSVPDTITLDEGGALERIIGTQPISTPAAGAIEVVLPTLTVDPALGNRRDQLLATNQAVQQMMQATETQRALLPTATPLAE